MAIIITPDDQAIRFFVLGAILSFVILSTGDHVVAFAASVACLSVSFLYEIRPGIQNIHQKVVGTQKRSVHSEPDQVNDEGVHREQMQEDSKKICLEHTEVNIPEEDCVGVVAKPLTEFERNREKYRNARIVPGVSGFSEFDKRRQGLAEKALPELRKLVEKEYQHDEAAMKFLTDYCLFRFLRAREGNADAAMVMIRTTINWRRKKNILSEKARCLICEQRDPKSHAYFCMGFDVQDRAVMYSCSARAVDQKDVEGGIFHMVAEMEHFFNDDDGVAQVVWIVDFSGFGAKHANPDNGRHAVHLFQQVYPERLGQLVLLDFPWIFSFFFKIVSPLLDPVTRNKILILRSGEERRKYYNDNWSPEMIAWMNEMSRLPAQPGVYPESKVIRSRHWT